MNDIMINIGDIQISNDLPFVLFGGMNVLEEHDTVMKICEHYTSVTSKLNIPYIFKASFDKSNRTSIHSYRGPGLESGLHLFQILKKTFNIKLMTDVHEISQVKAVSEVVDVIQLPAFLARQTDLIKAIAQTGSVINIKKPQYMHPTQIQYIIQKCHSFNNYNTILCERGTCFGYDNLVVDILGLNIMRNISGGYPILVDVTHSLQTRTPLSSISGGKGNQVFDLAKASIAVGIAGIFLEAHPCPDIAKCDGQSALPLTKLEHFLKQIKAIDKLVKSFK
ncbi:2-dehydro-3-deoxyphosphooctonate aldolase [Candidatus Blochmanniella vafra str. BVAF]|uniref:3-deoxy-8-phosphooctulonate synthase n=1 Tax=Blochmanniella vafra (strain BVAF) TaxID=859654 RepID=E8Q700_BLOVB|nr:3-deoxy-8-phosphooctulonate synthase [Candidatus Blochmannia vafer]ADV33747.1 2-dehydro-3-deoxyphosphooctonate aldolase [Candidatus Blochmannia vafer str. BVAF]